MLTIRKSHERGSFDHGWLKTHHTFSFAQYYDPNFTGYSVLRVINEDRIQGGSGFPMHAHKDMEIVTYVIDGAIEHKDSMGNSTVIHAGEVQRMTAGTGVRHSEFNHSANEDTHLLQIWINPNANALTPSYEQKNISKISENLFLVTSNDGRDDSVSIHQDVDIYVGRVQKVPMTLQLPLLGSRRGWLQMIAGTATVSAKDETAIKVQAGDGVAIEDVTHLKAECSAGTHFLFFDLP